MSNYHEPAEQLSEECRNWSRAITSMKEELEAIDWYTQRICATDDPTLQAALAHNRDEEIEHACLLLEWLRRNMDGWDEELRTFLFTSGDLTALEEGGDGGEGGGESAPRADLGIGKL